MSIVHELSRLLCYDISLHLLINLSMYIYVDLRKKIKTPFSVSHQDTRMMLYVLKTFYPFTSLRKLKVQQIEIYVFCQNENENIYFYSPSLLLGTNSVIVYFKVHYFGLISRLNCCVFLFGDQNTYVDTT